MGYWQERQAAQLNAFYDFNVEIMHYKEAKIYQKTMEKTIKDFEATYQSIQSSVEKGESVLRSHIYSLDRYWKQNAELANRLNKLGNKSYKIMLDGFTREYTDIYNNLVIPKVGASKVFTKINNDRAKSIIMNNTPFPDGKKFSERIWGNIGRLQSEIDENFIDCLVTGKKSTEFSKILRERFNVSWGQANRLIKTESAAVMTQSSIDRYKDAGINKVEFYAEPAACDECAALNGEVLDINSLIMGVNAPVIHPFCKCVLIPVVEFEKDENI